MVEGGRTEVTWAQMTRALRRLRQPAPLYQADKLLDYLRLQGVLLSTGVARFTLHPRLQEGLSLLPTGVLAPLDYLAYAASRCRAWERDRGLPAGGAPMRTR
jgi:hypothetical protein